jgi:16S rRNA (guanine527-N7)-methyltransferase
MFHVEHEQERLLRKHLEWVLATNQTHNLTAITDEDAAWRLHVLDSLAALPFVNAALQGRLLDIGSGGGFPGVPLGVASGRDTVCLDSVKKKTQALEEFLRTDQGYSNIKTSSARAEELAIQEVDSYAVVVSRAVAQLNSLVELASPFLTVGGSCLCLKGDINEEELHAGDIAAKKCGLEHKQIHYYMLEGGTEKRCVVEYVKVAESEVKLPRRIGVAQKRPYK